MTLLTIPSEDALRLYQEQPIEPVNGLKLIAVNFYEEWRWGNRYEVVVQDVLTEAYYAAIVEEQANHYHLDWEDEDFVSFDLVERIPVITYEYKKPENVER